MRDTLGFLKKSEEEKKMKSEKQKQQKADASAAYKSLEEVTFNPNGYQSKYPAVDYSMGPSVPSSIRSHLKSMIKEDSIQQSEAIEIKKLLFKSAGSNFHDSWH